MSATENFLGITGSLTCGLFGDCAAPPQFNLVQLLELDAGVEGVRENVIASFTPGQIQPVPEPHSILGILGLAILAGGTAIQKK